MGHVPGTDLSTRIARGAIGFRIIVRPALQTHPPNGGCPLHFEQRPEPLHSLQMALPLLDCNGDVVIIGEYRTIFVKHIRFLGGGTQKWLQATGCDSGLDLETFSIEVRSE
jgi:hypothetical protein